MSGPELAIAIPAYNEIDTLEGVVGAALHELDRLGIDGVVFIVDDGSTDGTGELADRLASADRRIAVQHHAENRGFSGAIGTALKGANARFVFLIPADGQVSPSVLADFWSGREEADVIVGVRRPRADSHWRRFLSWGFHTISRVLLGIRVTEFSSTFLFRRHVLEVPTSAPPRSAALLPELMARAQRRGARVKLVPYRHLPRAGGVAKRRSVRSRPHPARPAEARLDPARAREGGVMAGPPGGAASSSARVDLVSAAILGGAPRSLTTMLVVRITYQSSGSFVGAAIGGAIASVHVGPLVLRREERGREWELDTLTPMRSAS